ncbi:MAG: hypothetical protein ACK5RG_21710 [Cyclobacteriaceae bacterium]|jgi:hypothetical protein
MKKIIPVIIFTFLISSCDTKQKREQALKNLDLTQEQLLKINQHISDLENEVVRMAGELEVAKDDMNQVKEFQLLRTEEEREEQIRKSTEYRIRIEERIEDIKRQANAMRDSSRRTESKIEELKEFLKN